MNGFKKLPSKSLLGTIVEIYQRIYSPLFQKYKEFIKPIIV